MKKVLLSIILSLFMCPAAHAQTETVTLNTFYPAPFGAYETIRLVPRNTPPNNCDDDSLAGTLYIEDVELDLMICKGAVQGWDSADSIWTQDDVLNDVFLTDIVVNPNLQVGIGTTAPRADLHVAVNGEILLETDNVGVIFDDTNDDDFQITVFDGPLRFETGYVVGGALFLSQMILDSTGRLGLGFGQGELPQNLLDVEGAAAIGATYSGSRTAPANGLLVEGRVGVGTNTPQSNLDIKGGAVIGANYSGGATAPVNGLLVQGNVGIGERTPANKVDIAGSVAIGSAFAGTTAAPANGLKVQGDAVVGATSTSVSVNVGSDISISNSNQGRINFGGSGYIYEASNNLYIGH